MFLLDTNICIHIINQRDPAIIHKFQQHPPQQIALCSIIKSELLYGARHSQRVESNLRLLERFFAPLQSFGFDDACAAQAAIIRADLAKGSLSGSMIC